MHKNTQLVFWGSSEMSVIALELIREHGIIPALIITTPDRPAGRGRVLTPPATKVWAQAHNVPVLQPEKLNKAFRLQLPSKNTVFAVFAYGKILSKKILAIPEFGTLNIHPSMLPLLRGPSPVRTALLTDNKDAVGVSIILLDEKMDHGPILTQETYTPTQWPVPGRVLDETLSRLGGKLLAHILPQWLTKAVTPHPQDHTQATYCHFLEKKDGEISLDGDDYKNYLKICAYDGWPSAFTFVEKNGKKIRLKITKAHMEKGTLVIDKVIPEGKKEINYQQFLETLS